MHQFRVLVFPCGSECGLEIGRSLSFQKEIELWGGSSVEDHGAFFFSNYVGDLPFVTEPNFLERLNATIEQLQIDMVYPAMDSVLAIMAMNESAIRAQVVGSCAETARLALSKKKTYDRLHDLVRCPRVYQRTELSAADYPVFLKPEVGYGSRGVVIAENRKEVDEALDRNPDLMILEYFPGHEYTIDCFTNFTGKLLFSGGRVRNRIARGISVNTRNCSEYADVFHRVAEKINQAVTFNGAWFFQLKQTADGDLGLLEIAPRVAGSMGLHRCKGVNLPLLSVFNQAGIPVSPLENDYDIEFDRAFYNRVRVSCKFETLYLDFDDCLLLDGKHVNPELMKLVFQCRNKQIPVVLISRHAGDLDKRLEELGIARLLDRVIHLNNGESKADYMDCPNGFLVDDSFRERLSASRIGIPSIGPESVETLLD